MIYRIKRLFAIALSVILPLVAFTGCESEEPGPGSDKDYDMVLLVYAVASNNLSSNLIDDKSEMLRGLQRVDLNRCALLVYEINSSREISLYHAMKERGEYKFVPVKQYDDNVYSTRPERISQVIQDVRNGWKSSQYAMVFWSHGTGWIPGRKGETIKKSALEPENIDSPELYSFGYDQRVDEDGKRQVDQTDIDELASAIPDGALSYIWFDCCYMASIENLYQLRNKAKYIVAYPTEIYNPGLPYDRTLPFMLRKRPDLKLAATELFDYYNDQGREVTVAVADTRYIGVIAAIAKRAYSNYVYPEDVTFVNYSRESGYPMYDLRQFLLATANSSSNALTRSEVEKAWNKFVVFKASHGKDFNHHVIPDEDFSGISTHPYKGADTPAEDFYRKLDWYKAVFSDKQEH